MAAQAGAPVKGAAKVAQPMSAAAPNQPVGRRHRRRPPAPCSSSAATFKTRDRMLAGNSS
jgi:hypothetical protein